MFSNILISALLLLGSFYPESPVNEPCITKANTETLDLSDAKVTVFKLTHNCEVEYVTTRVFNRWGNVVAEEIGTNEGIDFTKLEEPVADGTYFYKIEYRYKGEAPLRHVDGHLHIVR